LLPLLLLLLLLLLLPSRRDEFRIRAANRAIRALELLPTPLQSLQVPAGGRAWKYQLSSLLCALAGLSSI
jgi:hypothetical protein